MTAKCAKRIATERKRMRLAPWQFSPSEISDGPNPYSPLVAGYRAWLEAQRWRAEIREHDPDYFD